jgi:molybdopterin molybdotransferase
LPRARLELSIEAARERIIDRLQPLPPVARPLSSSLGLTLSDEIDAPIDLPRYTNSAMDGFAVRSRDTASATVATPVVLAVAGELEAGDAWSKAVQRRETVRIATGAAVPADCDAVIPTERVTEVNDAILVTEPIEPGRNIRPQGEDIHSGSTAIHAGTTLRPQEIALLAALGIETAKSIPPPTVSIASIGLELIPGARPVSVFDANGPMLASQVEAAGGTLLRLERSDGDRENLSKLLHDLAADADLIVTSGGVSDSDADTMADVLANHPDTELWNVRLRPGKHLGFGSLDGRVVLALPGNPVAAFVTFEIFGRLAMERLKGRIIGTGAFVARSVSVLTGGAGRTDALRGNAWTDETGQLCVRAVENRGSGVLSSLPKANCIVLLPEDVDRIQAGELVSIRWVGYQ